MDTLYATALGGGLAIVGGLVAKSFEEWRTRKSLRAAFRAEIKGIVLMVETRGHERLFEDTLRHWKNGGDGHPRVIGSHEKPLDPVFSKNSDKIGVLGRDVAGEVVRFYSLIDGLREDIRGLAVGELAEFSRETKIRLLEEDLKLWADIKKLARSLDRKL